MLYLWAMVIGFRLSKIQLAYAFGLVSRNNRVNYVELRRGYMTDDILKQVGLTPSEFNKIKRFTYKQTLTIMKIFELDSSDFEVTKKYKNIGSMEH